jgi:hypothetical protein
MSVRVQVILDEAERVLFQRQAAASGLSLSAWLREAGRDRLKASREKSGLDSVAALERFFTECDAREARPEPDWADHLAVMHRSRASGESGT